MASDGKAGESGEALATDLRFFLCNLKSHEPSSVQTKGCHATIIIMIRFGATSKKKKTKLAI